MSGEPPAGPWRARYRCWIDSLSRERLLPNRRISVLVFVTGYAVAFAWRAREPWGGSFLFGLLVTLILAVRLSNLLVVRLLRVGLRSAAAGRALHIGLRPLVYGVAMTMLVLVGGAFVLAWRCLPGAAL